MVKINPQDKETLIGILKRELPEILSDEPVMIAYLFGSVVEGYARPSSDVDIALVLSPDYEASAYERMGLEIKIAAAIEDTCGIAQADVRSINQAPLTVRGTILTEGILLFSRDEEFRVDYEVYTRSCYFDFQPIEQLFRNSLIQQLREEGSAYGESEEA
jgi:predicted nucleotidyltransferase